VHRSLSRDALVELIRALVVTKLDYCCSVLVGVSGTLLRRLQSVLNAVAQIVLSARSSDHITPLLRELHWLKITERIQFRLCVLAYRCLHGNLSILSLLLLLLPSSATSILTVCWSHRLQML